MALALIGCVPNASRGETQAEHRLRDLKRIEQDVVLSGGMRELDELRARARRHRRPGTVSRPPRELGDRLGPPRPRRAAGVAIRSEVLPPINVRVNAVSPEPLGTTQSETAITALGSLLVAAWNDGGSDGTQPSGIGYATSADGGRTWIDAGTPPRQGGVSLWVSDPVLTVDEKRARLWLAAMAIADGPRSALAIVRGRLEEGRLVLETPVVARSTRDTFPDKPWIAADSLSGALYLSYTSYFRVDDHPSNQIELQRSLDGGTTWTPYVVLSEPAERGLVQGSRPAIGPDGEVHVVWKSVDTTLAAAGRDHLVLRGSQDLGASFGPPATVCELFTNFCSGPPGFNRGFGLGFPSIAVDRTQGPRRGRVYVAWEESLDFYDDPLGIEGEIAESESNGAPAGATSFVLGETLLGATAPARDVDWYRFRGERGQTVAMHLEVPGASAPGSALRLLCEDRSTRLSYSAPLVERSRYVVFTLPRSGDYYLVVAPENDSTGAYRIATGTVGRSGERGRDHRDVFVASSDDGRDWTAPVRIGDAEPVYDEWLPELAVAADGKLYASWYDWREGDPAGCGAASLVRMARSDDGGQSWAQLGPAATVPTLWSSVSSNLSPNQGDYQALYASPRALVSCWGDGRDGDPNVVLATLPFPGPATDVVSSSGAFEGGQAAVGWSMADSLPLVAVAYRRTASSPWTAVAEIESDAHGGFAIVDPNVEPGWKYFYRLGISTTEGELFTGETGIEIPSAPSPLAIERVHPNPSPGDVQVWFRRRDGETARLLLLDLSGRRVLERVLGDDQFGTRGSVRLAAGPLPPGVYLVELRQGDTKARAKLVLLPR